MSLDKMLIPPSDELAAKIKAEINEDDDRFTNNVNLLQKWADCQDHIPKNYDKDLLPRLLRGCKHDMEKAKRKFELLFAAKANMSDLFDSNFSENEKSALRNCHIAVLPRLTPEGQRVTLFSIKSDNADLYDINVILRQTWKIGVVRMARETLNSGDIYVLDCKHSTPAIAAKYLTPMLRKSLYVSQNACAFRFKQVLIINAPSYLDKIISVVKLLLKEKLRERIIIDTGDKILHDHIPEKCLPVEYGGTEVSMDVLEKEWESYMKANESWISEQQNMKLVGAIPKHLENFVNEDFGVQGSFRQLNLD